MSEVAIKLDSVSKDFVLLHEKSSSLKSTFTNLLGNSVRSTKDIQHALKDINLEINKGEFFGIVGRNGSGKSTLLKIIAGIYQPSHGSITINGKIVPFIELGVGFNPELTGRENVYLSGAIMGFDTKRVDAKYDEIVEFAELSRFMDQKLKNYSSGMQVRLSFSVATKLAESDILLIDEVLAVGDADFQRKCFDYFKSVKRQGKTVVFVSHDMGAIREYCTKAVLIEDSQIVASGSPSEVASKYSKMFIDSTSESDTSPVDKKRWGDKSVRFERLKVPKKLKADEDLVLSFTILAEQSVEDANFGFLVKNAAGDALLGTNTIINDGKTYKLKKGTTVEIEWRIKNVFNDGLYEVEPAIVYNGSTVADWWEGAAFFRSLRQSRTPYIVSPQIDFKIRPS